MQKNTQIRSVKHFALNIEIKPISISIIWPGSNQILGVENKAGSYKNALAVSAQGNNPSTNVKWDILNPDVEDVLYIENNILSWNAVANTTHIRFTLKATSTVDSSIVAAMDLELYITENDPYVATRTELNGPEEPEWDFSLGENGTDEFGITIFSNEITADTQPEDVFVYLNFYHINVRDSSTGKSFYVDDITYAPGLTPVNLDDWGIKITKIGDDAFRECSSLTKMIIPSSVESIGNCAFYKCKELTQVIINGPLKLIENSLFNGCLKLESIEIPNTVTSIGYSSFKNCQFLTKIILPSQVYSIGDSAFYNCSSLSEISIPQGLISIGNSAFRRCSSLTKIYIPYSLKSIGKYVFKYCSSLEEIRIPYGLYIKLKINLINVNKNFY